MIFIAAYIALLSMINVYRAYTCIQNAIDQTAKQVSEYAYIAKKLGVHNIVQGASNTRRFSFVVLSGYFLNNIL